MKKQAFCDFILGGVDLTDFGLKIPSPFSSLELSNSEIDSMTAWTLTCSVAGKASDMINISSMEALIYSAAQSSAGDGAGIPVSFMFGWLNADGSVGEHLSYTGFSINYSASTSGQSMTYTLKGFAKLGVQTHMPVLSIPAIQGVVQPSAIVAALAKATKATSYYDLDIDHCDAPTLVSHGAMTTSFNSYVSGNFNGTDDYQSFPGLVSLSKTYNAVREGSGIKPGHKLSTLLNNLSPTPLGNYLRTANDDTAVQCSSFSYWIDEPTMTRRGVIHYKANAGFLGEYTPDILQYGTSDTNVLSISGSYDGVAYNMTDMAFATVGFATDGAGNTIANPSQVVNSWSSSLAGVFQSANIINDVNALASQFSGNFTVVVPGSPKRYSIAQPVSLIVLSSNTLSPISGIYNIVSVSHSIAVQYTTTLKLQRLVMSTANQTAASQGIIVRGSSSYPASSYTPTRNIISTGKVDLGTMYPTFEDIQVV